VWALFGAKGGVGTSVVAAALAVAVARERGATLLVDLAGDQPAIFGVAADTAGIDGWLTVAEQPEIGALARLEVELTPTLTLLSGANGVASDVSEARLNALALELAGDPRTLIVDAGRVDDGRWRAVVARCSHRLLVTRCCYLALRRSASIEVPVTGVVVIVEPGRVIRPSDVEPAVGVPVVAEVALDPKVARSVDSGLLAQRLPARLARSLAGVWR
jgi:cellulose biosynthesis protein BcsQ